MQDALRPLWDFDDLAKSERRFRELLSAEGDAGARAEILTQLARVEGLRGRFDSAEALVREAEALAGDSARARIRVDLERGRILRSSGDAGSALPLFVAAYEAARREGELFIAADAAHMAAIAAPTREERLAWTRRGLETAESGDGSGSYWIGPLLNNLGWDEYEAGEHEQALATFEEALAHRQREPGNEAAIALARYAVGKAQQALGRHEEAASQLRLAAAWADGAGQPDGWYEEALAESLGALGRTEEAAAHARRALDLLPEADGSFAEDEARVARLRALAEPASGL